MRALRALVIVLGMPVMTPVLFAETLLVPDDYETIQDAIDEAVDGDVVEVAAGDYDENIDFTGKAITVVGVEGAEVTVIDAGGGGSVVSFRDGEGLDSILEGFTLTGGEGSLVDGFLIAGGGIVIEAASPTVQDCIITENTAEFGGGIYLIESDAEFYRCEIADNTAEALAFALGGGVLFDVGEGSALFEDCNIHHNEVSSTAPFGALFVHGGGVSTALDADVEFRRCRIHHNVAHDEGGGLHLSADSEVLLLNCTVYGNESMISTSGGIWGGFDTTIRNSILWGNTDVTIDDPPDQIGGVTDITYSNIEGGADGDGNIDDDPMFTDAEDGDFSLTDKSPCIDAGDPDDPADEDGTTVDMGAIPFGQKKGEDAPEFRRGDANNDGEVDALPDGLFLLRWGFVEDSPAPACDAAADVNGDGSVSALTDGLAVLTWFFGDGDVPPDPGPDECGTDPNEMACEEPPEGCNP